MWLDTGGRLQLADQREQGDFVGHSANNWGKVSRGPLAKLIELGAGKVGVNYGRGQTRF